MICVVAAAGGLVCLLQVQYLLCHTEICYVTGSLPLEVKLGCYFKKSDAELDDRICKV